MCRQIYSGWKHGYSFRNYEKEKRENNRDVNIYIDKFIVTPEKSKVKKGEEIEVEFKLVDCDGTPLPGREVLLQGGTFGGSSLARSTNGRFLNSTAVTNDQGIAKVKFKSGISPGKAVLRTYHKYFKPSGEEYCAYGEAEIEVKKERPDKYLGKMKATVTTHTASPNFSEPVEEKKTESTYFSFMEMQSSCGSIENLSKPEFRGNIFQTGVQYPVFWGITARTDLGEPNKVKTTIKTKTYDEQFGDFQLFYEGTIEGESNGYDWNFTVFPYLRQGTGIQSIDTKSQYCVKLYMTGNMRLHTDPKYKTTGRVHGRKRIDVNKFEDVSETIDEDSYLGVAQCDCDPQVQSDEQHVLPLIMQNPRSFEEFLLDPEGTFTLDLSGRWYQQGGGVEEAETTIEVKIDFTPID
ncbi:MAG: Ig-like domain-containing protein [Bacteroidetes bacterium]|nr:Ig-like domain-containing protein [Bacteroidota bacterium]